MFKPGFPKVGRPLLQTEDGLDMDDEHEDSPLMFPCRFPIKAMGLADPTFEDLVVQIVNRHLERPFEAVVNTRLSRGGKWVSVTLTIEAQSRQQLDAIYRELSAHERVAYLL